MNEEILLLAIIAALNLIFAVWNAREARDFRESDNRFISKLPKYLALILSMVAAHSIATVLLVAATLSGFLQDTQIENLILNSNVIVFGTMAWVAGVFLIGYFLSSKKMNGVVFLNTFAVAWNSYFFLGNFSSSVKQVVSSFIYVVSFADPLKYISTGPHSEYRILAIEIFSISTITGIAITALAYYSHKKQPVTFQSGDSGFNKFLIPLMGTTLISLGFFEINFMSIFFGVGAVLLVLFAYRQMNLRVSTKSYLKISAATMLLLLVGIQGLASATPELASISGASNRNLGHLATTSSFALVGGQTGMWFSPKQDASLLQIANRNENSIISSQSGTVWTGDSNGTDWLVGGYGGSGEPKLYILGEHATSIQNLSSEWDGGDIFAISHNTTGWLISGMGSGTLPSYSKLRTNHLSLGFLNYDGNFTDLSASLPVEFDGALFASAYNGSDWLIGGGYGTNGVLVEYNGTGFRDLTPAGIGAVHAISWNGKEWLIGGMGFLSVYKDGTFYPISVRWSSFLSVNSIVWNGTDWLIGGGPEIGNTMESGFGWLGTYSIATGFVIVAIPSNIDSSVLSVASFGNGSWLAGGYVENKAQLVQYSSSGDLTDNYSVLLGNMTYVNWLGTR